MSPTCNARQRFDPAAGNLKLRDEKHFLTCNADKQNALPGNAARKHDETGGELSRKAIEQTGRELSRKEQRANGNQAQTKEQANEQTGREMSRKERRANGNQAQTKQDILEALAPANLNNEQAETIKLTVKLKPSFNNFVRWTIDVAENMTAFGSFNSMPKRFKQVVEHMQGVSQQRSKDTLIQSMAIENAIKDTLPAKLADRLQRPDERRRIHGTQDLLERVMCHIEKQGRKDRAANTNELRTIRKEAGEGVTAYFGRAAKLFETATRFEEMMTDNQMKHAVIAGMGATFAALRII
jgi:hypothetical protein